MDTMLETTQPSDGRRYLGRQAWPPAALPSLTAALGDSLAHYLTTGLAEALARVSPITAGAAGRATLRLHTPRLAPPAHDVAWCRRYGLDFSARLTVTAELTSAATGEIQAGEVWLGDLPLPTAEGTVVIAGADRLIVAQLVRAPGPVFAADAAGALTARLLTERGLALALAADARGGLWLHGYGVRLPVTMVLRALGHETDADLRALVGDLPATDRCLAATLARDASRDAATAAVAIARALRPERPLAADEALALVQVTLFDPRRVSLGRLGRRRLHEAVWRDRPGPADLIAPAHTAEALCPADLVALVREWLRRLPASGPLDDVDHLGRRRVRPAGEALGDAVARGLDELVAAVERQLLSPTAVLTPARLVSPDPLRRAVRAFFRDSPLAQLHDQTNPLAALAHRRRLSALGPGGLSRDRAAAGARDVHPSQYGRLCPVETPEGPSVGLITSLATYAHVDELGLIATPYRPVATTVAATAAALAGRILRADVTDPASGRLLVAADGRPLTAALAARVAACVTGPVAVVPFVGTATVGLTADEEAAVAIADGGTPLDEFGNLVAERVRARRAGRAGRVDATACAFLDAAPGQVVGAGAGLIPFLEHDDPTRAQMGATMQRQALPLLRPEAPLVGTGLEAAVACDSGWLVTAEGGGTVVSATAAAIVVEEASGQRRRYPLRLFERTNQETCRRQRPCVRRGERVVAGQVLADDSATAGGELALGCNALVAFLAWDGATYEDAVVLRAGFVQGDGLTSIHLEEHTVEVRDTPAGRERLTRAVPHVGDRGLAQLDARGIARLGARVGPGDLLVGKVTPRAEADAEADGAAVLARASVAGLDTPVSFGDRLAGVERFQRRDAVKDTSLRVPPGSRGTVVDVVVEDASTGSPLPQGVEQRVRVTLAQRRPIQVGDKLAGRHGNKGVVARIVADEDMPFLPDGRPIDVLLNPLGVPSRMNLGQLFETQLGWACRALGWRVAAPAFDGPDAAAVRLLLVAAGLPADGTVTLYDGRTGAALAEPVTVGVQYLLKLHHEVDDKLHARATGPYALLTGQPVGGRARVGGQRVGEMEVWALEAHGAAHTLRELLTLKADDVAGRRRLYEAIVQGRPYPAPATSATLEVLLQELEALGMTIGVVTDETTAGTGSPAPGGNGAQPGAGEAGWRPGGGAEPTGA
ncbi:MAG: DNA-directed RNA polymerase subunit beta [Chloroflexi bacterium]|nr:DNA-directed RNA polymerase subunit beta [Chloroflexota bacterium]